jgi:hypothetical protein
MGYTHYWTFKKAKTGQARQTEQKYQKAVADCNKIIQYYSQEFGGLSGYSAHTNGYDGINFNGSMRVGQCEDFVLRERFSLNEGFNFCKTNNNPYDTVVTACLIVLKHRLGDNISVSSDGRRDDWNNGLILAKKVLKLSRLNIPESIEVNEIKTI